MELKLLIFYGHILCDGKRSVVLTVAKDEPESGPQRHVVVVWKIKVTVK